MLWEFAEIDDAYVPKNLVGIKDAHERFRLITGVPNLDLDSIYFGADSDFPDDKELIDTLGNTYYSRQKPEKASPQSPIDV